MKNSNACISLYFHIIDIIIMMFIAIEVLYILYNNHVSQFLFPQCTNQYIKAKVNNKLKNEIPILRGVTHHFLGRFGLFQQVRLLSANDEALSILPVLFGKVIPIVLCPLSS